MDRASATRHRVPGNVSVNRAQGASTASTGATGAEVMEALSPVAVCAGVPRAKNAVRVSRETFAAMKAAQ